MRCVNNKEHDRDWLERLKNYFGTMGDYSNDHVFMTIDIIGSFERYNNRPYHNYETWATGYRITLLPWRDVVTELIIVDSECIQCACEKAWMRMRNQVGS